MLSYRDCIILIDLNTCNVIFLCSAMDGRILKPTHPAMSIDSTLIQRAFGSGGPQGEFAAAFTEVHLNESCGII